MKINTSILLLIIVLVSIAAISYVFFVPRNSYRNDCDKPLTGYDILFVYLQACSHCKADYARMQELNLTERFYMIDAQSSSCMNVINQYSDYIVNHKNSNVPNSQSEIATPTKVCLRDNSTYVGEMQTYQIKEFYENCTGVKI